MTGAKEYAELFDTGQYGKLYITSGSCARGRTFHIQVLPEGEEAIPNGSMKMCINENTVEVYGFIDGSPGLEEYGWLYKGKWQGDFHKLVAERRVEVAAKKRTQAEQKAAVEGAERVRKERILANY